MPEPALTRPPCDPRWRWQSPLSPRARGATPDRLGLAVSHLIYEMLREVEAENLQEIRVHEAEAVRYLQHDD